MGTNFYLGDGTHLGKRSFAGAYCHGCDRSLITHQSGGYDASANPHTGAWRLPRVCPGCGIGPKEAGGVSSFAFALPPEKIGGFAAEDVVKDEYGREMSMRDFRSDVVESCRYLFTDTVGIDFS